MQVFDRSALFSRLKIRPARIIGHLKILVMIDKRMGNILIPSWGPDCCTGNAHVVIWHRVISYRKYMRRGEGNSGLSTYHPWAAFLASDWSGHPTVASASKNHRRLQSRITERYQDISPCWRISFRGSDTPSTTSMPFYDEGSTIQPDMVTR